MAADLHAMRFYGILDTAYVSPMVWVAKCHALIEGGADMIQFRAKRETRAQRIPLLEKILPLFEESDVPLIINDDIDLVLQYPGLGLHIGQNDTPPREARQRIGPDRILGLSTHTLDQAQEAITLGHTLNYFAVGPVFATPTKPNYTPVGIELVSQVTALNPPTPFFAIGGVSRWTVSQVKAAGAPRVVVVSDVLCVEDTAAAVREIRNVLRENNISLSPTKSAECERIKKHGLRSLNFRLLY